MKTHFHHPTRLSFTLCGLPIGGLIQTGGLPISDRGINGVTCGNCHRIYNINLEKEIEVLV